MGKTVIYPSGHGRNGERHLSKDETRILLYGLSFKKHGERYLVFPDDGQVTIHGERDGVRIDLILSDVLTRLNIAERKLAEHSESIRRFAVAATTLQSHYETMNDIKVSLKRRGIVIEKASETPRGSVDLKAPPSVL